MRKNKKKIKERSFIKSPAKKKILLLLFAGIGLGLTRSPSQYIRILEEIDDAWKEIDREYLRKCVKEFYRDRLVDFKENSDGTCTVILTEKGENFALRYNIDELKIDIPEKWDGKWRIVVFDIPESFKVAREALRNKLKELGLKELQKSVWIFPYDIEDAINFIVEYFEIRPYVRYIIAEKITNEEELRLWFDLV